MHDLTLGFGDKMRDIMTESIVFVTKKRPRDKGNNIMSHNFMRDNMSLVLSLWQPFISKCVKTGWRQAPVAMSTTHR